MNCVSAGFAPAVQVGVDLFEREQLEQDLGAGRRCSCRPERRRTRAAELRAPAQAGMTSPEHERVERDADLLRLPTSDCRPAP